MTAPNRPAEKGAKADEQAERAMYPDAGDWTAIKAKVEGIVSLGAPVCDVCREMKPDKRPGYTTRTPTLHVDTNGRTLGEWLGKKLCPVHADGTVTGTHRVECRMETAEDRRGAYRYTVVGIRSKAGEEVGR